MNSLSQDSNNHSELVYKRNGAFIIGVSGLIYTPVLLTLVVLLCCVYRVYKTAFQRLTLYHILIVLFCECTFALQIENWFEGPRWLCVTVSYLLLYCLLSWYIYTTAVTNFSFVVTLRLLKTGDIKIRKGSKMAECVCLFVAVVLPMAYLWVPIRDKSHEALICDDLESSTWHKDALILYVLTLVMSIEVVAVSAVFSCLFCYLRWRLKNKKLSTLLKHLLYLTGINTVVMAFATILAVYGIYRYNRRPSEAMSIATYAVSSAGEPFAFCVSAAFQSFLSIRHWHQTHSSTCSCCIVCCKRNNERLHMNVVTDIQTNPPSRPLNQPSHTYFSVPYTGAFTQVSSISERSELRKESEKTPLIMHE